MEKVLRGMHNHPKGCGGAKAQQSLEFTFGDPEDPAGEQDGYGMVVEKGLTKAALAERFRCLAEKMDPKGS